MAYTPFSPIAIGSSNWGAPLNNAISEIDSVQMTNPDDHSLTHWTQDPVANAGGTAPTSGTVQTIKLWVRQPMTASLLAVGVTTPGVTLTAGQNFLGLYNSLGIRIGLTADQSAAWLTAGYREAAIVAPVALTPGAYYVAILANAATPPAFARGGITTASIANPKQTAADARFATGPTAQTSLPASITLASRTVASIPYWVAMG